MKMQLENGILIKLMENGSVAKSEEELYRFGLNQLFLFCLNIGTTIGIGVICNMLWQSILFSLAYIPLRRYAGGYHAKTPRQCYFLSILLVVGVLQIIAHVRVDNLWIYILLVITNIFIYVKVPKASEKKPLTQNECIAFRRKARTILCIENIILILGNMASAEMITACITMSILTVGVMIGLASLGDWKSVFK